MTPYMQYRQQLKNGQIKPEKKPPRKIRTVSVKRAAINREYAKESRPFWKGKACQIRSPVCTGTSQGVHHRKGKSTKEDLMDKRYWMAACNHCNSYVEVNDAWARKMGYKISRLKK
ncbi:hypothetical protein [Chitinophaga japonensis]|uniref:hypothetical protein n=1 Tax=Chitinophaga japonensis TaxID=104662 RepID=UPI00119EF490|nr:hypothetical protein [Chitinophaga japonensis]